MTTKQTTPYAVNYIRLHPSRPKNKRLRTPWTISGYTLHDHKTYDSVRRELQTECIL